MEIHAYDEEYLTYAQRVLGDMMDFAVNTCDMGRMIISSASSSPASRHSSGAGTPNM